MQSTYRPGLPKYAKNRPVFIILVDRLVKILELIKLVNLLVKPLERWLLFAAAYGVHVQRGHHLVARLVVQESLVLNPIVDLEIAAVGVQLDKEWGRGLTLVLQTVRLE